jgi:hypothetical protein
VDKYEIGAEFVGSTGHRFVLVAIEPYKNKRSGRPSVVLVWSAACRVCGAAYLAKSGPTAAGASVHCEAHKLSRAGVQALAVAAMHRPESRRKAALTRRRRAEIRKLF